jgi:uncharacterized protein
MIRFLKASLSSRCFLREGNTTEFWDIAGVPVENLSKDQVMSAEEMVDASLAGLSQGEFITIPALPNNADWEVFEAARQALFPNLSHSKAADRYRIPQ